MSTKLLAGLLAMMIVAGVGIYAGVSHFTAPSEGVVSGPPAGGCCQSSQAMLPVCSDRVATVSCCADDHDEESGCCAAKAKSKTQSIAAFTGVAASTVEPRSEGCPKCKEHHCEEK